MKAIMKYPGSKWGTAAWIIGQCPDHHSYLEPFFGSGAVFFNKPRSDIETINDINGDVVNLFKWIKDDPEKLAHEIYFTPYSRAVYEDAYQREPENSLEAAVLFYIRLNMGHGFRTNGKKSGGSLIFRDAKGPMPPKIGRTFRGRYYKPRNGCGAYR